MKGGTQEKAKEGEGKDHVRRGKEKQSMPRVDRLIIRRKEVSSPWSHSVILRKTATWRNVSTEHGDYGVCSRGMVVRKKILLVYLDDYALKLKARLHPVIKSLSGTSPLTPRQGPQNIYRAQEKANSDATRTTNHMEALVKTKGQILILNLIRLPLIRVPHEPGSPVLCAGFSAGSS